ncbi:lactonase family protein [Streptomyces sp. B6B3]|uniref:lactonase family protein n=1 Tax=Streptomyces sp. B6B3 TaxID=3153570 RepID=UPI00325CFD03
MPDQPHRLICVGSYTPETGGTGPGVTVLREPLGSPDAPGDGRPGRPEPAGELRLTAASWLQWHPWLPVVYAVRELAEGAVSALLLDPDGTVRVIGEEATGGADPCHLAVTPDGDYLLAANYGSGSVAVFGLDERGAPTRRADLVEHSGSGPVEDRQEGPHAHMVTLDPAGSLVCVTDLGSDRIWAYRLRADGTLARVAASALPPGTGPRQLVRAPGGGRGFAVAELGSELLVLSEEEPGAFVPRGSCAASDRPGTNFPAHLALSPDGLRGYLSNRGADTVATFDLTGDRPERIAEHDLGAAWPRHFALVDDRLYVAAQQSDEVVALDLDPETDELVERYRIPVGSPACVAVQPRPA